MYFSSSPVKVRFVRLCSVPVQFGNELCSTRRIRSDPLTEYVPKYEMLPAPMVLYSSRVPCARLFEAYLGRSARINIREYRPLGSKISRPFGLGPKASAETIVQVPTRSFADWPTALLEQSANPNAAIVEKLRMLRRFIVLLPRLKPYSYYKLSRFEARQCWLATDRIHFHSIISSAGRTV